ncbi:hypothetical protein [Desulfospira joergensenii]|uniref:hypothetical protein n=1 Tax=Desulfospira joergensenii TaxID=53329 RepID=UPI0003B4E43C|nr:hypothetical protein [Desulfospira joergensenii]
MKDCFKRLIFVFTVLTVFGGSAWAGWFTFEPNLVLMDGTAVARYLEDIGKENAYQKNGDTEHANQLISDEKVYLIKSGQDQTRVKYIEHEEYEGNIFVHVQDESGTKVWANMVGLACVDKDGKERTVTKQDLTKGEFEPLPK